MRVRVRNQNLQGFFFPYETSDKTSDGTLSLKPCVFYLHSAARQTARHGTLAFALREKHGVVLIK